MVVKIFVIHPGRYRYPMFRAAGYPAKEEVSGASLIISIQFFLFCSAPA